MPTSTAREKTQRFEPVDLQVLAHEVLGDGDVAQQERLLGLGDLGAGELAHAEDDLQQLLVLGRLEADHREHLGDVHALVAHALDVLDHVQQRGDDAEVGRDGRLQRQQGENPLLDLQVAPVDAVVVVDDDRGELDVLVLERLERAVERGDDEVDPAERLLFEGAKFLVKLLTAWHPTHVSQLSRTGR